MFEVSAAISENIRENLIQALFPSGYIICQPCKMVLNRHKIIFNPETNYPWLLRLPEKEHFLLFQHFPFAITNFRVLYTCEKRFDDVIGQSTGPMYSYAKIPKHG